MRIWILALALLGVYGLASAAEADEIPLTIKDHQFSPAEVHVPANQAATLKVTNADPTAEEFESDDLDIEKVIAGGQSAVITLDPLEPGKYEFYGEYHEDTAKGVLIAE
jgi:plastocyanin